MTESYPCYVRIGDENDSEEIVELPTDSEGTILLSTVQAQYPDAIGLKFKSDTGSWRGIRLAGNVLNPPIEGWGNNDYYVTLPKTGAKRKFDDYSADGVSKTKKISEEDMLQDLIVLGLPYTASEEDMKSYFETFGELDMYQIKLEAETNKSRGFGFIRFKSVEVVEAVLAATHTIMGRKCQVRFPLKGRQDDVSTKLFVGRLAGGTTMDELREYFSQYGVLTDVYIPTQFRGFGFITFASPVVAREVMNKQHSIKGNYVNLSFPTPKGGRASGYTQSQNYQGQYGYGNMQGNMMGPQSQGIPGQGYGYGNQGNNPQGYYSGYFQSGGKVQGGKVM